MCMPTCSRLRATRVETATALFDFGFQQTKQARRQANLLKAARESEKLHSATGQEAREGHDVRNKIIMQNEFMYVSTYSDLLRYV